MATENRQSVLIVYNGLDASNVHTYDACLEEDLDDHFPLGTIIATVNPDPPEGY